MAVLTVQTITRAWYSVEANDVQTAAGGDSFANTGVELVAVKNASGGAITVTLDIQATTDSQAVTDKTVSVTAAETFLIGPFPTAIYNDANGRTNLTYSTTTGLTILAFKPTTA